MKKYFSLAGILACTSAQLLAAQTASIEEIVVEAATKSEQKLKEVTSNVEVITSDEIEQRHFHGVIEALSTLNGISFTQSGGIGQQSNLYLRGMGNKYTLVVVDGIRMNDVTNFDGAFFDQLQISDIERIEVIKGAQSGIWGADASAGVINIVTKKAKPHHATFYGEMGSFRTQKYGSTFSHVMSQGDVKFGFDRLITDGISAVEPSKGTPSYGQRGDTIGYEKDRYLATTINVKGGANLSRNDRIDLAHKNVSSMIAFDKSSNTFPYLPIDAPDSLTTTNHFQQRFSQIGYAHTTENNLFKVYSSRSDFKRSQYGGYRGQIDEIGMMNTYKYLSNSSLTLGATTQLFDVGSSGGEYLNLSYRGRAIFASNTNVLNNEKTVVTQSLRYDDYSIFGSKMTGKVGVKQTIGDVILSSNYGTAFQAPNLTQITPPSSWGMAPNYQLKPENIKSFDLTGSYKNISLTYFYNTIKDMIDYNDPDGWMGPLSAVYANIDGTSTLQGYEAKVKFNPYESVLTTVGYTKLHSVDSRGVDLARRPHDTLTTTVDWYPFEKLHCGTLLSYIGERYDNSSKTVSTGGYTVINLTTNYELSEHTSAYIKLDNLLDRYYQVVDGYATAGRSFYVGFKASF